VPLASLTSVQVNGLYRTLRASGRKDYKAGGPLSARTVRYIATILAAALQDAVDTRPQLLQFNPADSRQAKPPSAKFARAPEMHPWNAAQLGAFLTWSRTTGHPHTAAWHVLAMTGMRRGEVLGLLWGDVDLDAGTLAVRRSAGMVKVKGVRGVTTSGDTKTGRARVVDLDPGTVAVLRAHKAARRALHLDLARDAALVFGDEHGRFLRPDGFSRTFVDAVARCAAAGHDVPRIRCHDLRHTPRLPAPRGGCAGQGRERAAGARQPDHHPDRLRSRDAGKPAGRR
jgi:integrase